MDWGRVLRQAVIPVASAYAGWLMLLLAYRRQHRRDRPVETTARGARASYRDLVRYLLVTAAGGFGAFLAIVVVFYFVLGDQPASLVRDALVEGAWLAFGVVVPGWLAISWLHDRRAPR